jgi:transcriptional regulator with XRE-family HTH domain
MENPDAGERTMTAPPGRPLSASATPSHFIPLIRAIMENDHIKHSELAKRTGFTESKVSRILATRSSIDSTALHIIFDALKIDLLRALLAVGRFGNWRHYFDPDLQIIADLVDVLPASLSKARSGNIRSNISLSGTIVLADRLSQMVATNDREIERRQQECPIAGL